MGLSPPPQSVRFAKSVLLGILAIFVLPLVAIAMVPIWIVKKLARLGDIFHDGFVAFTTGQHREE